jgi:hypothetical protein
VAIPVSQIHEKCCDTDLTQFSIIDGDSLDNNGSTCDKVIECDDKYYLIEEKSIVFAFLNNCCIELGINLDDDYKFISEGIEHIHISKIVQNVIQPMDINVKKRILSETITQLIATSGKKASNATHILSTQYDSTKTHDMPVVYLYCNSGKGVDAILSSFLSRYKKLHFLECKKLKKKLQEECR